MNFLTIFTSKLEAATFIDVQSRHQERGYAELSVKLPSHSYSRLVIQPLEQPNRLAPSLAQPASAFHQGVPADL
jgi:hypothetical protein